MQLVVLHLSLTQTTATPVFVPVYVAKTRIRSAALRTYIAGWARGLSAGPVLPDSGRVATVAAAGTSLLLLATGLVGSLTGLLWAGVVLPGVLSYLAARCGMRSGGGFGGLGLLRSATARCAPGQRISMHPACIALGFQ